MRRTATVSSLLLAATVLLAPAASAATTPGEASDQDVPFRSSTAPAAALLSVGVTRPAALGQSLSTGVVEVGSDLAVIGATWTQGTGSGVKLSYREKREGEWGTWQEVDIESCADCAEEGAPTRDGSEAIAITGASHIEARLVATAAVTDARLALIDPEEDAEDARVARRVNTGGGVSAGGALSSAALTDATGLAAAARASGLPAVPAGLPGPRLSMPAKRADWRATESRAARNLPVRTPRGVVVHHTAGGNVYRPDQVPGILRGIQRFHVRDRGWADIAYTALVDRYGTVWEGRVGGIGIPHQGAHAAGVNDVYAGIAYLGDTTREPATDVAVDAMVDLLGWASARYGYSPTGTISVRGAARPVIAGHHQVNRTSCPGRDLIARLPEIRDRADRAARDYRAQSRVNAARAS